MDYKLLYYASHMLIAIVCVHSYIHNQTFNVKLPAIAHVHMHTNCVKNMCRSQQVWLAACIDLVTITFQYNLVYTSSVVNLNWLL